MKTLHLGVMNRFIIDYGDVLQVFMYVKTHQILLLKYVLYLKKILKIQRTILNASKENNPQTHFFYLKANPRMYIVEWNKTM